MTQSTATRRILVLLVVAGLVLGSLGVAALSLLGGGEEGAPVDAPTTTPAPGAVEPPDPGLARFYGQQLEWQPCREGALCATLEVPLDYRRPGGTAIELAVLKVPAADPERRIGSLVVNPGGPGAPGTDYAASADRA